MRDHYTSLRLILAVLALTATTGSGTLTAQATRLATNQRAARAALLERHVQFRVDNVSLVDGLRQLEERSGVPLAYSPSLLPVSPRVTCRCAGVTIREALTTLLAGTGFTFREMQGQLVLLPVSEAPNAGNTPAGGARVADDSTPLLLASLPLESTPVVRSRELEPATVNGTVRTEGGAPVPMALVSIPSLRLSTTTNEAGTYRLAIPSERVTARAETLYVTRIGYRPATVPFALRPGDLTVDVVMSSVVVALERVLVTGTLGNQQQKAQPAVVASIDATDITAKAAILSVTELLYARTPGVSITAASGTTGTGSRISIRGQASLNLSNRPLIFIDGLKIASGPRTAAASVGGQVIDGLSDLNPDDIESIEIVKGPAAAALYGADASAGVIQILTKRGRTGGRSFSQRVSTEYHDLDPNFTPTTSYYKCLAADIAATSTSALCKGQPLNTIVTDNPLVREGAFRHGQAGMINYSAMGSGENFGYFTSFNAENETGTLPNNVQIRRTGRANMNWTATPTFSLDANIGLTRINNKLPIGDQGSQGYLVGAGLGSPRTVRTLADGSLAGGWLNAGESVTSISSILNENVLIRTTPGVTLRYSPRTWFSNQLTLGADITTQKGTTFYPKNDLNWYSVLQNTGFVAVDAQDNTQYTATYQGNISQSFGSGGWITSNLSFGTQWLNNVGEQVTVSGNGLVTNSANTVSRAGANRTGAQGYGQNKQLGIFGQEMIGFNDRLYVKLAGRMDQASAFARNAQRIFLPSVGVSWVLSQEPMFERFLPSLVSTFKVRAAYGETGRSPGSTAALQTYSAAPYVTDLGLLVTGGVTPDNPGNPDLKPERGTEFEGGIDAGFFNDRLGLEATYFAKVSKNLIVTNPVPASSGFLSSPNVNIGTLTNKGLELSARATAIDRKNVSWDIGLTMNTLANKLVTVKNVNPINNRRCFKAGYEIGAFCVNRIRSIDTTTGVVVVSDTAEFLGGQLPKQEGALTTTLTLFRNFRIYALADGKFNYRTYNFGKEFQDRSSPNSALGVLPREQLGLSLYEWYRLHPTRVVNESGATLGLTQEDEDYFEDASFIRFRELSLTWTVPLSVSQKLRLAGSSITVGGRNLGIRTKYKGYDPEVLAVEEFANPFRADLFTVPPARRLFARLSLQF